VENELIKLTKILRLQLQSYFWYSVPYIKVAALSLVGPVMLWLIYLYLGKLSFIELIYGTIASFVISLLIFRPIINDLFRLSSYVNQLASNTQQVAPKLESLRDVVTFSTAITNLNNSWQKKRLELESKIIESKLLFDSLPDVLLMLDDELNILRYNPVAYHTFQCELAGKNIAEIINNKLFLSFIKWTAHDRKSKSFELFLEPPVNKYYRVHIEQLPLYIEHATAIIIVMTDITEAKLREKTFTDFVANASHEIRTPLASIKGFIEIIQTSARDDPHAQEKFLKIMGEQTERLTSLVNDLLSLSKIEMYANTPPEDTVNLASVLHVVVQELDWNAEQRNMVIELQIEGNIPQIIADAGQITQLFTNLIGNAIKYGRENSTITVAARYINDIAGIGLQNTKAAIEVAITDQGEGIESEHIPQLTERFYRVDSARTRHNKTVGTGLGLSIVKQIINRHQGILKIESTVGVGSTFTVFLPTK
jgi:two-component system phosphate regulon sensor histidine kinase PhoR